MSPRRRRCHGHVACHEIEAPLSVERLRVRSNRRREDLCGRGCSQGPEGPPKAGGPLGPSLYGTGGLALPSLSKRKEAALAATFKGFLRREGGADVIGRVKPFGLLRCATALRVTRPLPPAKSLPNKLLSNLSPHGGDQ